MDEQLLETGAIPINLYLLDAVPAEALGDVPASKGRTVAEQFAHLHPPGEVDLCPSDYAL